jgi:hypothetical protein
MAEINRLGARRGDDDKTELVFALEALHKLGALRGTSLETSLRDARDRLYPSERAYLLEQHGDLLGS